MAAEQPHLKLRHGAEGATMPAFGLGTWLSDKGLVQKAVHHAIEVGYRHIDAAFIYQNEAEVGAGIREAIAAGHCTREELWVTTKLWNDAHEPSAVQPALETSLGLLGLDYVDLYLVHWPVAHRAGVMRPSAPTDFVALSDCPLEDTWGGMAKLPATGKARNVGVSNFNLAQIDGITKAVGSAPAVNQVELHPYLAQNELLDGLRTRDIVPTGYCPLGSGGRPPGMRDEGERRLLDDPTVAALAEARQATPAQVLLAWALARQCAVIPKSTNPGRIAQNFGALELKLSEDELRTLNGLDAAARYVTGDFWCPPGSPYTLQGLWG